MKISPLAFASVAFCSLLSHVLSSNPDSVMVQDSSEDSSTDKTAPPQQVQTDKVDSRSGPRNSSRRIFGLQVVRIFRPHVSGSRIVWKETGMEGIETMEEGSPFFRYMRQRYNRNHRNLTGSQTSHPFSNNRRMYGYNSGYRDFRRNVTGFGGGGYGPVRPPAYPQSGRGQPFSTPGYAPTTPHNQKISPDSNFFSGVVNNFAFKLVETMNLETNFVISPLSIFMSLSMVYLGSDGNTKAQLEEALGMNANAVHGEHFHKGIKDLISLVPMPGSSEYDVFVANAIFMAKNFVPDAQFARNLQNYYFAEAKNLDFANPQASLKAINDWVAESTRNMITSLIEEPLSAMTRLILLNAVYFKGVWHTQFPPNLTHNGRFYKLDGTDKKVPTMTLYDEKFPYLRSEEDKHFYIKLPYQGNEVSMVIALPFESSQKPMPEITDQHLCDIQDAMVSTKINTLALPKFRLDSVFELQRPLSKLGITDIFDRRAVNLRKMRRQNDVYVSEILHKSVLEVDEAGTRASASTSVRFVPLSLSDRTIFVANHPFSFYIVHEQSGLVLFYGKIFDLDGVGED